MDQSRPIRVLHLVNGEYWSGAERVQTLLGTYANRAEFSVEFLCLKDGLFLDRARDMGLTVAHVPMRGRLDLSVVWRIAAQVRRQGIDVIHTHTVRTNLIGRLVGLITGTPVVSHVHSPSLRETDSRIKNAANTIVDRLIWRLTTRYVSVSQSLGEELCRSGVPRDRLTVIPNGIDLQAFQPDAGQAEARRTLALEPAHLVVAMVGLFRPRKGAETLITAFQRVVERLPDARLVLLGPAVSDAYLDELRTLARTCGVEDYVVFTGFRNDVAALMAAFDVVAMPSLYGEGTPMALLEAMAAARPVVATPVEGIAEVMVDGETGLLTPVGDATALAEGLIRLLSNADYRRRLGAAARARIEDGYSAERMTRATEELYTRLIEPRQRRQRAVVPGRG